MIKFTEFADKKIEKIFSFYPKSARSKLLKIRELIFKTAQQLEGKDLLVETLKWGEPSYDYPKGSAVRIDWKEATPDQYRVYFHCQTKLVSTFKTLYPDTFSFEGNRAIVFQVKDPIPEKELRHCIHLSLTYHQIKKLPLLGARET